ncbi:putative ribonuclease VapC protein [Halorhabdus tiamatea SARL4B]|nr:PIN domain-containing protein [Halorhabdus tiamatea]ERJ05296.1 putative ribonuclease VapC protein [Halorhabdus tiamatea SARL4B]
MARVVVDSNVLIAARLSNDQDHDRGRSISRAIDRNELPTAYVPSNVFEEVLNYLQTRAGHDIAIETLDALVESGGYELSYTPKADFNAGRSIFRTYDGLSLTDAIIVATMQRQDVEYLYSFDDDFDAVEGITGTTARLVGRSEADGHHSV